MGKYTTKDSGERTAFKSGGQRDTTKGKPRFDLLFPKNVPYDKQFLTRVAELMARGAEKYEERNWEQFADEEAISHAEGSLMRHVAQYLSGETDEDHAAAVVFNLMAIETIKLKLSTPLPSITKSSYGIPGIPVYYPGINDHD
jgi:hypothetical protein